MLGATVPTTGGIKNAFKWGDKWKIDAVQFYLTLSRRWEVSPMSDKEIKEFRKAWRESNVKEVVAHIPYLVNLVSDNKNTKKKSINRLVTEIERAKLLGVKKLVLHPGSSSNPSKIFELKNSFDKVFQKVNPVSTSIMIETMAGQGNALGGTFKELAEILSILRNDIFGICFDSAHVFEAGYDLKNNYEEVLQHFNKLIPLEKIKVFHINDSKTSLGSRKDRHAEIGQGKIGLNFFQNLLNDQRFKHVPKIIETPQMGQRSLYNLKVLKALMQ